MPQHLPSGPNLDHLKKQAKDVLRLARCRSLDWRLTDAHDALARGYGFDSWPMLKRHVESKRHPRRTEPSARRARRAERPGDANQVAVPVAQDGDRRSAHPLAGAWVMRPSAPSRDHAPTAIDDMLVEFDLKDDALTLTQIVVGASGRPSAMKTALQPDGQDHATEFGDGLVLRASWTDERTLALRFTRDETVVGTWAYTASVDGRSLLVTTTDRVLTFERAT